MTSETEQPQRIGGSDIAGILGISPWATQRSVYNRCWGLAEEKEGEWLEWGNRLEDAVARKFKDGHDDFKAEDAVCELYHNAELKVADLDFAGGHPDRQVRWNSGTRSILELKTCGVMKRNEWGESGEGRAGVPAHYLTQVDWYMVLSDAAFGHIALLIGGQEYREFRIERDADREEELLDAGAEFWRQYVLPMIPPPLIGKDEADFRPDVQAGAGIISANAEAEEAILILRNAIADEKDATDTLALARVRVKKIIGGNLGIEWPGGRITYKPNKLGTRVFLPTFKKEEGDGEADTERRGHCDD